MRLPSSNTLRRPGFTLIEVLVAAGLCMLIMSVITVAFSAGIDTFSLLKSIGEANGRLALTQGIMQSDLREVHLEDDTGLPLKVSQVRYDLLNTPAAQDAQLGRYVRPPARGFFRILQETVSTGEGLDPDGLPSTYANNHILHMTVRRTPDVPAKVFTTRVPNPNPSNVIPSAAASDPADAWTSDNKGTVANPFTQNAEYQNPGAPGTPGRRIGDFGFRLQHECMGALSGNLAGASDRIFASPWAEVVYFLRPTGTSTAGGGRQLFSLHRRVRVLTKNDQNLTQLSWNSFQLASPGMSCAPGTKNLNGPGDITIPGNRLGGLLSRRVPNAYPPAGVETVPAPYSSLNIDSIGPVGANATDITGEDILLTNVISFEIKASWDPGRWVVAEGTAADVWVGSVASPGAAEFPFADLPPTPSVPTTFTQMTGGMTPQTITFPSGSGNSGDTNSPFANNNFTRDFVTSDPARAPSPGPLGNVRVFDTWTSRFPSWNQPIVNGPSATVRYANPTAVPLPIRVKSIQIKLRIYDPKNKLTRQVTFKQDV